MSNERRPPIFPGLRTPAVPFDEVRDRRRAFPLYIDVDLSVARAISAGTHLVLTIAGSFFYVDQDPANVGFATMRFVDNQSVIDTPIKVGPGSSWRVPFTGLVIENAAQPGLRLRIIYGVDIDTVPGINAQVVIQGAIDVSDRAARLLGITYGNLGQLAQLALGGVNALQITERGYAYGANFVSTSGLLANASQQVVAAAANVNGLIVWRASGRSRNAAAMPNIAFAAAAVGPNSVTGGDVLATADYVGENAATSMYAALKLEKPVFVAAGKGLFWTVDVAETAAHRAVSYTLL